MSVTVYTTRLFGGRDIGVSYDATGQTLSILGQAVTISSLSAALQGQWQAALAGAGMANGPRGAFGGDNIGQIVGSILDAQPAWATAVRTALAGYVAEQSYGNFADASTFNR